MVVAARSSRAAPPLCPGERAKEQDSSPPTGCIVARGLHYNVVFYGDLASCDIVIGCQTRRPGAAAPFSTSACAHAMPRHVCQPAGCLGQGSTFLGSVPNMGARGCTTAGFWFLDCTGPGVAKMGQQLWEFCAEKKGRPAGATLHGLPACLPATTHRA